MRSRFREAFTGWIIVCQAALVGINSGRSLAQPFPCPIVDPLCQSLPNDCHTTIAGTDCHPRKVVADPLVAGGIRAVECSCYTGSECGGIVVQGNFVSCTGFCPVPPAGNECNVNINGAPSGLSSVDFTQYPPGTTFECGCNPNVGACMPNAAGDGCTSTQCSPPNLTCIPKCIRVASNGQQTVVDCDCLDNLQCHIQMGPVPSLPDCVDNCPPGYVCVRTETYNPADGSTTYCCECQQPPICGPDPSTMGATCTPVACPGPGQECKPKCIEITNQGQIKALNCECRGISECHAEMGPALPICVEGCPPGQICVQNIYTTSTGTAYCCECVEDPQFCEPTTDGQGCKPFNCPPDAAGLPETCKPRCVRMSELGTFTVIDCNCRGTDECHVVFEPGLTPYCQGGCPPGETCVQNIIDNQDGTIDVCCDCIPPVCKCPGDIDGNGILNALDIAGFVRCLTGTPLPADNCACADIDGDGDRDFTDLNLFVIRMLGKAECDPCCPRADLVLNLGTGVDDQGNLIPIGNGDDNWVVTAESTSYGALGRPATVVTPHGSWFTIPGTRWISNNYFAQNGTYEYEFCFCLDDRYSNPSLTLQIRADDSAPGAETKVFLNNNYLGDAASFGAAVPATLSTSNPNFFQKGRNCVKVIVINSGGAPTGFNMAGTVTAKDGKCCCPPADLGKDIRSGVYDGDGLIPIGFDDDTWEVTVDASGGGTPRPAKVINKHAAWGVIPGTQWISAAQTGPNGLYVYKYCFCLDPRFKNAKLTLDVLADDNATIWFNGGQVGATPSGYAFLLPPTRVVVTNQDLFKPCENCIEIRVNNTHGVVTGVNIAGTITAIDGLCCDDREYSCCLPDGNCIDLAPGVTQCPGEGTLMPGVCGNGQPCCMPNGSCQILSPRCCSSAGGTILPPGTVCGQPQACCIPGGGSPCGTCINVSPACCSAMGGTPQGPGSSCQP